MPSRMQWRLPDITLVVVAHCLLAAALGTPALADAEPPKVAPPATTSPQAAAQEPVEAQEAAPAESAPVRVMVNKSVLINTADRLKRVSVTDPAVADAVVLSPYQVMVHGRSPGEVTLILWDEQERTRTFDLRVDVDVTAAMEEIHRIFQDQKIDVSASRSAIVLSGHVVDKETAERAGLIAGAYSKNVVNVLTYGPVGAQEILLEVKFAEVDRAALSAYGFNIFSTGGANTFGAIGTQQFSPFTESASGFGDFELQSPHVAAGRNPPGGAAPGHRGIGAFGTNDILNLFLFRTDINLGTIVKALQQKNILQILAEPNLIAVNGKEASFLAGGEIPIPVPQGGAAVGAITIVFKEFGVRLSFTPVITPTGNIHLKVMPEVSALDFANAIRISGFTVPAFTTRRAQTELQLQDGQSFAIAGLLDNRLTHDTSKVPVLGDIPVIGYLFRSKNFLRNRTELMVLVTARRVSPSTQPQPLPGMPKQFLDEKKFDQTGTSGGSK